MASLNQRRSDYYNEIRTQFADKEKEIQEAKGLSAAQRRELLQSVRTDVGQLQKDMPEQAAQESRDTASPQRSQEATQNVMLQTEFGTGLGRWQAMQDPNYKVGSGSSLRRAGRAIGPESGRYMREARKLKRAGFENAAERMAAAGSALRVNEPNIVRPEDRAAQMLGRIEAGRLMQQNQQQQEQMAQQPSVVGSVFSLMNRLLGRQPREQPERGQTREPLVAGASVGAGYGTPIKRA